MTTADELRTKPQLFYDDVAEGQEMLPLVIGPLTPTHLFRWSAAIENWHRIHYDQNFAVYHDGSSLVEHSGSGLLEARSILLLATSRISACRMAGPGS